MKQLRIVLQLVRKHLVFLSFLVLFLVSACTYALLTPAFQVIDETGHFMRAYGITEGQWRCTAHQEKEENGLWLPISVAESHLTSGLVHLNNFPERRYTAPDPIYPNDEYTFLTNVYCEAPPTAYLPQSIGISIAKLLHLDVWGTVLFARIANILVSGLFLLVAFFLIPTGKHYIMIIGTIPMMLFQISSASPDAMLFSGLLLFLAWTLYLLVQPKLSLRLCLFYVFASFFLLNMKVGYQCFAVLALAFRKEQFGSLWKLIMFIVSVILGNVLVLLLVRHIFTLGTIDVAGINRLDNALFIVQHPFSFLQIIWNTFQQQGWVLLQELFGSIGWQNTLLPFLHYVLIGILFWIGSQTSDTERQHIHTRTRIACIFTGILVFLTICASLFVLTTSIDATSIRGLQGKYFLPVLFLCIYGFYRISLSRRTISFFLVGMIVLSTITFGVQIQQRYHAPLTPITTYFSYPVTRNNEFSYVSKDIPEDRIIRLHISHEQPGTTIPYTFKIRDYYCNESKYSTTPLAYHTVANRHIELHIPEELKEGYCISINAIRPTANTVPLFIKGYWDNNTFHPLLR